DLPEVRRLVLPIDARRRDVLPPQQHVGVLVEHFPYIGFVVLTTQGEQHAAMMQLQCLLLKLPVGRTRMRFPQLDSGQPVLDYNPTPEHVVAIQYQALAALALQRPQVLEGFERHFAQTFAAVRRASHVPVAGIMELTGAQPSNDDIRIDQVSVTLLLQQAMEPPVKPVDRGPLTARMLPVCNSQSRLQRQIEPKPQNDSLGLPPNAFRDVAQEAPHTLDFRLVLLSRAAVEIAR